jgi:cyanophycin synthetase
MKNSINWWAISSQIIIDEAHKLWFNSEILIPEKNVFCLLWQGEKYWFKNIDCWLNSAFWFKLSQDKELTYKVLWNEFPIPRSLYLNKNDVLSLKILEDVLTFPLVVKPSDTDHGDGVSVNILDFSSLQDAVSIAFGFSNKIIIQSFVQWFDHRIFVVGDHVSAVAMRVPPSVVGDGIHTIEQLISIENNNPLRGSGDHDKPLSMIKIDEELNSCLKLSGLSLSSIMPDWQKIFLRRNANLSTGGSSIDYTDVIHEDNRKIAIAAAKKLGLVVAWVDIVCEDISQSIFKTWWAIIEINNTPGLRMHHFPSQGFARNPALDILKLKFRL